MRVPKCLARVASVVPFILSFQVLALNPQTGVGSSSTTQAKTGGSGSGGTYGVGSVGVAPDLFTGILTHMIPLEVVQGRHGLQPDLQLRYRSSNGNGIVGVGWELNLGDIERRTKGGLNYSGDDYVLRANGSAADLIDTGNCGTNCTQYAFLVESEFLRVQKLVGTDGVPYWQVTDRAGTIYRYGWTSSSRQYDPGDHSHIFKWCLDYTLDTAGNYITYSYATDGNITVPSEIDYTGHVGDLAPTNAIVFCWLGASCKPGSRPDSFSSYATSFSRPVYTSWLLDHIDVNAGGRLVRRFQLSYIQSSSSNVSLLSSVAQIGKDGTSTLPVTTFDWSASGTTFSTATISSVYGGWDNSADRIRTADVDGDGYEDLVLGPDGGGNWYVFGGSSSGMVDRGVWAQNAMADWGNCSNGCQSHIWMADLNGDGKADILLGPNPDTAQWTVMTSTGTGFSAPTVWAYWNNGGWFGHSARIRVADIDGDGKADILVGPNAGGNWHLLRSTGSSFELHENYIQSGLSYWDNDSTQTRVSLVDVTGDGLPDLVLGPDSQGSWRVLINLGGLSGFSAPVVTPSNLNYWSGDAESTLIRTMDVNGDGKMDIVIGPDDLPLATYDSSGFYHYTGGFYALVSKGDGHFDIQLSWCSYSPYAGWSGSPNRIRTLDVNADGLTDMLIGPDASGSWYVLESRPYNCLDKGPVSSLAGFAAGAWDQPQNQTRIRAFDANGDGRQDIVVGPDSSGYWYEAFGAAYPSAQYPDLLIGIHNGYGAWTTISYQPSTRFNNTLLPFAVQVVNSSTTNDGNGLSATTQYSYSGGYFHLAAREYRGFAATTATGPAWPNGARPQATTYFLQGNGVPSPQGNGLEPAADDPTAAVGYMKGKIYRIKVGDSVSTGFVDTFTGYQTSTGPTYFNPVCESRTVYCTNSSCAVDVTTFCPASLTSSTPPCAGPGCGRQTRTIDAYDGYGNIIRVDDYGDTSVAGDEKTVFTSYSPNASSWIIGLPTHVTTYSTAGVTTPALSTKIAESWFYYDGGGTDCSTASATTTPSIGNLTRTIRWLNGGTNPESRAAYDGYGNAICSRDANGNVAQMAYDSSLKTFLLTTTSAPTLNAPGGLASATAYYGVEGVSWSISANDGVYGLVQSTTDPNLARTQLTYDVFGRPATKADPDSYVTTWRHSQLKDNVCPTSGYTALNYNPAFPCVIGSQSSTASSYLYSDGIGRTIVARRQGSSSGRFVDTQTIYLASGAISRKSSPYLETGGALLWTTYQYDGHGRPVTVTNPDGTVVTSCYDDLTGATASIDPNAHRRREVKDAQGHLIEVDEYRGAFSSCTTDLGTPYATTKFSYDSFGHLEQILNAVNSPIEWAYDTLGRKISASDPDLGTWSYSYDGAGNLVYQQDANGHAIYLVYDRLNRVTLKHYCITSPASLSVCQNESTTPNDVVYLYDSGSNAKGRVTQMNDGSGSPASGYASRTYSYDILGRVLAMTQLIDTSATYTTRMTFDASTRRLSSIIYPDPGHTEVVYSYDQDGNLYQVKEPTSQRTYATFTSYNESAQPGSISYGNRGTLSYTYDPGNHRLIRLLSGPGLLDLSYSYDGVGNITAIADNLNSVNTQTFGYDELNRLVSAQSAGYEPDTRLAPQGLAYTYDAVRVHTLNSTSDGRSFQHDGNGNTTSDGVRTMGWNFDNRPISITTSAATTNLTYDGTGLRVKKQGPNGTVLYSGKLYECAGGSCIRYVFANSMRIASVDSGGATYYFHLDHLSSTRAATDSAGGQSEQLFYYPYGQAARDTSPVVSRYKFTNQELDNETGLYNFNARLYDPSLGRFTSADTIAPDPRKPQTLNRYAYAVNNPVRYADPSGHFAIFDFPWNWFAKKHLKTAEDCPSTLCTSAPGPGSGSGGGGWFSFEGTLNDIKNGFAALGSFIGNLARGGYHGVGDVSSWLGGTFGGTFSQAKKWGVERTSGGIGIHLGGLWAGPPRDNDIGVSESGVFNQINANSFALREATTENLKRTRLAFDAVQFVATPLLLLDPGLAAEEAAAVATARNYRALFEMTMPLPEEWEVHHALPQLYEDLMLSEMGVNVHDLQYLRGVDQGIHRIISQQWALFARTSPTPAAADVLSFAEQIDVQWSSFFIFP